MKRKTRKRLLTKAEGDINDEVRRQVEKEFPPLKRVECDESPNGNHSYTADLEYDPTGNTENCEWCGELKPE